MKKPKIKANYDASSIKHLKGPEAIRVQLGMYVGATDSDAITHLVKEVLGNSVDEAASGHGDTICLTFKKDTIIIADHGRGIPVGPHPDNPKIDTLELVATELHAGGKSSAKNSGYEQGTLGVFGVGLAVVNALCTNMQIWSFRNKKWYTQTYEKGIPTSKVIIAKGNNEPPIIKGHSGNCGTIVSFKPDISVLDKGSKLKKNDVISYINNLSWFVWQKTKTGYNPISFIIYDSETKTRSIIKRKHFSDIFESLCKEHNCDPVITDKPLEIRTANFDAILGWTSSTSSIHYGYANSLHNPDGGSHVNAFKKTIKNVIEKIALKKHKFNIDNFLSGAILLINIRIKAPKFAGNSKHKLISDVDSLASDQLLPEVEKWAKKNKKAIIALLNRALEIGNIMDSAKVRKALASAVKSKSANGTSWPKGFVLATTKDNTKREIFCLEGESAGGLAKKARNSETQEIYPLTGKIPNTIRNDKKAFANDRIKGLLKVIGYDPTSKNPIEKLRCGKIILMTDSDDDGPLAPNTLVYGNNKTLRDYSIESATDRFPIQSVNLKALNLNRLDGNKSVESEFAIGSRKVISSDTVYEIQTGSSTLLRADSKHFWPVFFPAGKGVKENSIIPIRSNELEVGMHLLETYRDRVYPTRINAITVKPLNYSLDFYCLTAPKYGNFIVDVGRGRGIISYNSHITSLVLSLLYIVCKELFEKGMVYIVDGPLYKYQSKSGNVIWAMTYKELIEKAGGELNGEVERAKGWGQANPDDAAFFAFNPETRKLIQVTPETVSEKAQGLLSIMGDDPNSRKKLLGII